MRALAVSVDVLRLEETETGWCGLGLLLPSLVHPGCLTRLDCGLPLRWRRDLISVSLYRLAERRVALRHRYLVASSPVVAGHLRSLAPRAEVVLAPLSLGQGHCLSAVPDGPPVAGIIGTGTGPPAAASIVGLYHACPGGVRPHVICGSLSAAVAGRQGCM